MSSFASAFPTVQTTCVFHQSIVKTHLSWIWLYMLSSPLFNQPHHRNKQAVQLCTCIGVYMKRMLSITDGLSGNSRNPTAAEAAGGGDSASFPQHRQLTLVNLCTESAPLFETNSRHRKSANLSQHRQLSLVKSCTEATPLFETSTRHKKTGMRTHLYMASADAG